VSDVDRAKAFYVDQVGFHADHDQQVDEKLRFVQLTPPGSACSISVGIGLSDGEPGSVRGVHLVVTDIVTAHKELVERGVPVGDIRHMTSEGFKPGPDPEHADFNSFAEFADPDGNTWVLQEKR
jgi:catechol 2,3-dioxygenase-like lactoylglutathione lyase family enzyme